MGHQPKVVKECVVTKCQCVSVSVCYLELAFGPVKMHTSVLRNVQHLAVICRCLPSTCSCAIVTQYLLEKITQDLKLVLV